MLNDSVIVINEFSLPSHIFSKVFPFHLVFDEHMQLLQIGEVLQRICPGLAVGTRFEQHFRINRPNIKVEFNLIREQSQSLFMLESLHNKMQLKGQMVYVEQSETVFFLGSPWITDLADLNSLGLTLKDFAIHDPVVDFLFLLQTQNTALSDAKKLADKLSKQREDLRKANQQLRAQYAATRILAESLSLNEAIDKIIAAICEIFNWQVGVIWSVDERKKLLYCQQFWKKLSDEFEELESITQASNIPLDAELPGHVWQICETVWVENISTEANSARKLCASRAGLQGVFYFPIKIENKIFSIVELFSYEVRQPDGRLLEILADINTKINSFAQRQKTKQALIKQTEISESLRAILDNMGDAVIVIDQNQTLLTFNPAAQRLFGIESTYLAFDQWCQQYKLFLPDKITALPAEKLPWFRSSQGEEVNNIEIFVRQAKAHDGIWVMATGRALKDKDGLIKGNVVVCRDITARKLAEKQLLHDSLHDGLTSLANRVLFNNRLESAIAMVKECPDYTFAVLFMDLDRFKIINDSLGHIVGDQLLMAIADRLKSCVRPADTIARLGGDEFTILLEDIKDVNEVIQIAERIQALLLQPYSLSGHEVFTSASIGIAFSRTGYERPEDILRDADTAMYRAKTLGKSRYEVFNSSMHTHALELLHLENDMRRGIERQEFKVYYQPIVSLKTNTIIGFEALVRWEHPTQGLILPAEFIPMAEDTGLIIPIGWSVLRQACYQMRTWQMQLPAYSSLIVSVNLSAKQFMQPDLVKNVNRILEETSLDASSLKLEITESVAMKNAEVATAMLRELRKLGMGLSIDDFGTGYSSLAYLHRFPIDTLKIDRSFINRIDIDGDQFEIVRLIVKLALNLGMDVIAEGIETNQQLAHLLDINCQYGQGHLFYEAIDSNDAEILIFNEFSRL
ncbi:MAG: EAL domain-containing protein [Aphanothece sp. CMT-3BRIN-NPC111]|jgi:diguanylate cyclase (GGDEF)-like protein/PAS domain S-box-containing protein|nr:EAL domain-containing protein [Aphanothece sp. CMT-3BRIN-NPC111]